VIHPDDIDGLIGAIQPHLAAGHVGYAGLFSPVQLNYHGMWSEIVWVISDLSNQDFDHPYVRRLREEMNRIVDSGALPPEVFAVNATFHGREALENHQPVQEAAE
jgi:hypothetical protein